MKTLQRSENGAFFEEDIRAVLIELGCKQYSDFSVAPSPLLYLFQDGMKNRLRFFSEDYARIPDVALLSGSQFFERNPRPTAGRGDDRPFIDIMKVSSVQYGQLDEGASFTWYAGTGRLQSGYMLTEANIYVPSIAILQSANALLLPEPWRT